MLSQGILPRFRDINQKVMDEAIACGDEVRSLVDEHRHSRLSSEDSAEITEMSKPTDIRRKLFPF